MKLSKLTKPELEEIFRNANFTEEEEKVFKMLSCGKTITETAQKINVCDRTVNRISKKVYRSSKRTCDKFRFSGKKYSKSYFV